MQIKCFREKLFYKNLQNRRNLSLRREYVLARMAFGAAPLAVVPREKSFDSRGSRPIDQLSAGVTGEIPCSIETTSRARELEPCRARFSTVPTFPALPPTRRALFKSSTSAPSGCLATRPPR